MRPDTAARRVWAGWLLTRAATVALYEWREHLVGTDANYYWQQLHYFFQHGNGTTVLREYPVGALATMLPEYGLTFGHEHAFKILFAGAMLALDALLLAVLLRHARPGNERAAWYWVAFGFALGPVTYFRFDLVTAVLAVLTLLALQRREASAGGLLGAAVVIKVWPVLLVPAALIPRGSRVRRCVGGIAVGVVTLAGGLALGGWTRLLSPLRWQQDRGLQIESVVASPLMIVSKLHPSGWSDRFEYGARQLHGPGVATALHVTTLLEILTVLVVVVLAWRQARHDRSSTGSLAWCALAAVLLIVIANKTLSPQYLVWVGALAALVVGVERSRPAGVVAGLLLAMAVLTRVYFPALYAGMLRVDNGLDAGTVVLVVRNAVLVLALLVTLVAAWRATSRRPDHVSAGQPAR